MAQSAGKVALRAPAVLLPLTAPVASRQPVTPQASPWRVSSPQDPAEREAVAVAAQVVRMGAPAAAAAPAVPLRGVAAAPLRSPWVARLAPHIVQRRGQGVPALSPQAAAEIAAARGGGQALPATARAFMEPRFRADFSAVRVHTDARAQRLAGQLQAQAFTVGGDIFFGAGRYAPYSGEGRELLAHELTHTLQQGAAVRRSEAGESVPVQARTPRPEVQRLGLSDALDYFAEHANHLPGFRMLTVVLGMNPITMRGVDRSPANILRAIVEFLPGGHLLTQALDNHGVFDRIAAWVAQQFSTLVIGADLIRQAIDRFLESLSWRDIFDLGGVFRRALNLITAPIDRLVAFGRGLLGGIVDLIKQAILRPLGRLAEGTRGYDLLRGVLGFDPVTGDAVRRTPALLIGGFMRLIGQEEVWDNIQRGNAAGRAWAWFQGAMGDLLGFVRQIPTLFMDALRSLSLADTVQLPAAFARVGRIFGDFIVRFLAWAGNTVWNLLEIVFSVVAPGVMGYLRRAGTAIRDILRNPMRFVGNLIRAATTGFRQFAGNFLNHLMAGMLQWLTGALPGVYIPQALNLVEIAKFVMSVLGITWQNIRVKLVRHVGEPAVRAMEMGFELLVTLVRDGPMAAWEQLQEQLANLRQMAIDSIRDMIIGFVVERAIPRLVAMFIPGAGFIAAIVSIYGTITTMMNELQRIVQVVTAFLDSMMAIASGNITAAAARVEQVLARGIPLVISFVAGFLGLGNVAARVRALIERIRAPIDRAMDRVVAWIVNAARRLGRFVRQNARRAFDWVMRPRTFSAGRQSHRLWVDEQGRSMLASDPAPITVHLTSWRNAARAAAQPQRGQAETLIGQMQPLAVRLEAEARQLIAARRARDEAAGERAQLAVEAAWNSVMPLAQQLFVLLGARPFDPPFRFSPFNANVSSQPAELQRVYAMEFARQVMDHQNRLNQFKVSQWNANRAAFVGRGAEYNTESRQARERMADLTRQRVITSVVRSLDARGVPPAEAQVIAERTATEQLRGRHATHTADAISGGNHEEISRMGLGLANSTIGSQWRVKQAQEMVLLQRVLATVDPDANMNLELTVVGV